ncbi:hypothetical protein ACWD6R_21600 [Streptomyces sp. NPDC005151]
MPIVDAPEQFNQEDLYLDLHSTMDLPVYLKCEGFNFADSIKLKAATEMVDAAERQGLLSSDSILIESSSGNLGVALSSVPEAETVRVCHQLARTGFMFGGSTGTVIAGARGWLAGHRPTGQVTAVAIAPDFGERYLDTLYRTNWVREFYGPDVLDGLSTPEQYTH